MVWQMQLKRTKFSGRKLTSFSGQHTRHKQWQRSSFGVGQLRSQTMFCSKTEWRLADVHWGLNFLSTAWIEQNKKVVDLPWSDQTTYFFFDSCWHKSRDAITRTEEVWLDHIGRNPRRGEAVLHARCWDFIARAQACVHPSLFLPLSGRNHPLRNSPFSVNL